MCLFLEKKNLNPEHFIHGFLSTFMTCLNEFSLLISHFFSTISYLNVLASWHQSLNLLSFFMSKYSLEDHNQSQGFRNYQYSDNHQIDTYSQDFFEHKVLISLENLLEYIIHKSNIIPCSKYPPKFPSNKCFHKLTYFKKCQFYPFSCSNPILREIIDFYLSRKFYTYSEQILLTLPSKYTQNLSNFISPSQQFFSKLPYLFAYTSAINF